jgi:hypothetical protein
MVIVLRIALAVGFVVDGGVGVLCLFFQPLVGPIVGVPLHDPPVARFLGGELIVVAGLYALLFREPVRWNRFLWLCALDQTMAAALPLVELTSRTIPATWQTIGPIPLSAALVAIYVWGARTRGTA